MNEVFCAFASIFSLFMAHCIHICCMILMTSPLENAPSSILLWELFPLDQSGSLIAVNAVKCLNDMSQKY